MKRMMVLALVAGLLAGASAYPGLSGARGVLRVVDARSEGNWNGSLMVQGFSATWPGGNWDPVPVGLDPTTTLYAQDGLVSVGFSPIKWFELFCWSGAVRETITAAGDTAAGDTAAGDAAFYGYHSLMPGAKLSIPVIPVAKLGAMAGYSMYPIQNDFRGGWSWGKFSTPFVNGPVWAGLLTLDLRERVKWTPTLHLNYGKAYDTDTDVDSLTTYTTLGAALEYEIGKLDLFAEFVSVQIAAAPPLHQTGRMYLTPGLKVGYLRPLVLQVGASIGLTDSVAPVEYTAGLGLSGPLYVRRKPTVGTIAGRVVDAATGKPLAATVGFHGLTKPKPLSTNASRGGTFRAKGVKPGAVIVKAAASGYEPAEQEVNVVAGKTSQVELALVRETTTGTIVGRVTDPATGAALAAQVELKGASLPAASTDAQGDYRFDNVPAGEYTAEASAEGYMTASATIAVVPKQETRGDFQLVKKGITITLKVYFDFDKATLKPESHAALEAAAKIMKENPTIRVEIQGHTDNIGTAAYNDKLSLRRAQAVVDYLVGTLGVDPGRLTAKGYGLTRPVASDETREGRAQNRRVEFLVIE